jgi:hypothetical protein
MNISATLDGESVSIVDIDVNGHNVYVTYVNASSELLTKVKFLSTSAIATSATIV